MYVWIKKKANIVNILLVKLEITYLYKLIKSKAITALTATPMKFLRSYSLKQESIDI